MKPRTASKPLETTVWNWKGDWKYGNVWPDIIIEAKRRVAGQRTPSQSQSMGWQHHAVRVSRCGWVWCTLQNGWHHEEGKEWKYWCNISRHLPIGQWMKDNKVYTSGYRNTYGHNRKSLFKHRGLQTWLGYTSCIWRNELKLQQLIVESLLKATGNVWTKLKNLKPALPQSVCKLLTHWECEEMK